jgi:uncharacterized protein YjbI with pentapeptide repeats
MKTWKPQRLSVLTRTFENEHQPYLVVSILVFFPFEAPAQLLPEVSMWKFVAAELGKDAALDLCMPKERAEVLVHGRAYPVNRPQPACAVQLKMGTIDKKLYVVGDRHWEANGASAPIPFEVMPVGWENAYGGEGYAANPHGKGAAPIKTESGRVHWLPNVEDPKHLMKSPGNRPVPVGFGAYEETWPQRFKKLGTYDQEWLEKRFPGFAKDMDWGYFNIAPEDQRIQGFFAGGEAFSIENMHPEVRLLESRLPAVTTRCFLTLEGEEEWRELPMRIDTVRLFPHAQRGVAIYRAVTKVREDDAADVLDLLIAAETIGEPKPRSHYVAARANRADRAKGALYALRDRDLMPELPGARVPVAEDGWNDTGPLMEMEHLALKNVQRRMEKAREDARKKCEELGLDPDKYVSNEKPLQQGTPDLETLPELIEDIDTMVAAATADAEEKRIAAEQVARDHCEANGIDYDKMVEDARSEGGGPPKFSADRELERIRDLAQLSRNTGGMLPESESALADPELESGLRQAEAQLFLAYRRFTHFLPAAAARGEEEAAKIRADVIAARAAGESLSGRDLTGADLSGLDLKGADLTFALLERANLKGANLTGADLTDATLARADLTEADLSNTTLIDANLALATLVGARLAGADLTRATLSKADLSRAVLDGATFKGTKIDEAILKGADFSRLSAAQTQFTTADLSGLKLCEADLSECVFYDTSVAGADFTGALMKSATFINVRGEGAIFKNARAHNMRFVTECSFPSADFSEAELKDANLRKSDLTGADFTRADLTGADLSESKLAGARFYRAKARNARFSKADLTGAVLTSIDLMYGILERSRLHGADLRGANLFRADLAKIRADKTTNFKDANLKQIRVVAVAPNKPREVPRG